MSRGEFQERKTITYIDRFQIPLAIAVLFLLIELFIPLRAGRVLGVVFIILMPTAQAQTFDAYQKNNKGIQSYQAGDMDNAAKYFEEAAKSSPNNPKIDFNKGVIASQKGEADQAQQLFESAISKAQENGDLEMEAEARYNLGSLLEHKKDYNGAAKQWSELSEKLKEVKQNPELVEKSKERIANLFQKKKQQEQQDKEDKENKDKKDDQGKDDKKDSGDKKDKDQKNDGDDEEGKDKEKDKQSYKKGNQFKSTKLSKEDAERVMAELLGKEKELQKKIGKKRGKVNGNNKDW